MHSADQDPDHLGHNTIQDFIKLSKLLSDHRYTVLKPNTIDMVAILLLAAAINEELFFDVVAWGEYTRLASKATFSRRKDFLEGLGVIYEENVRAPYGRPRIRLRINEDKFKELFKLGEIPTEV
ncbi:MAG TPA: DUF5821 family protein [Methanocella sp.]|nr:DUF5821 family protein [Methanocella sp.]